MDVIIEKTDAGKERVRVIGLKDGKKLYPHLPSMEGTKKWLREGGFSFEATPINLAIFAKVFPEAPLPQREEAKPLAPIVERPVVEYISRRKPFAHQRRALDKWGDLPTFAIFMEMGTGKSKLFIDKAGKQWCDNLITGVLVVAKRGKHIDWIDEDIPLNLGAMVPWFGHAWDGKEVNPKVHARHRLAWLSINPDALKTAKGQKACLDFIEAHKGHVHMVIDESQDIKNASAKRTQVAVSIGALCKYRTIMTGSPIAKNLLDAWSQFKFLDERIIGMRYATTFKAEFCVVDRASHLVVGAKNVDRFFARIDKWCFRVTKAEELDLPPKIYKQHPFEMSDEQAHHYENLKATFRTQLDSGEKMSVTHVATMMMRLQQITCGVITDDEGTVHRLNFNSRLEALKEVMEARTGKMIIWARFQTDIEDIMSVVGEEGVAYYGRTKDAERQEAKRRFLDPHSNVRYFVSNPQVIAGVDGMQNVCSTAVYYSNSFNALDRWQSEDRIDRIGMKESATYIDLVCRNSIDRRMLANLRAKKSLSDLALDDIRLTLEAS